MMIIDPHAVRPLYAQVEDALTADMVAGRLPPGSQLAPEDSLIARFAVSRTTIRTTIQNMVRRGLLEIRRGRGTFVTQPKLTQELTALTGFVEDMTALGLRASAKVLDQRLVAASETVAARLALRKGAPVVRIDRVRLAEGVPISVDETYLPRELGEKIMTEDLSKHQIFSLLEQKYDTPLLEADYRLEAVSAAGAVAKALKMPPGSPIFLIERTSYTVARKPVDYEKLYYRGDHIRFATRLRRSAPNNGGEAP